MIQRHMTEPDDESLFEKFDYFNDFEDTVRWLNSKIVSAKTEFEKERLKKVVQKLNSGNEVFLKAMQNRFATKESDK